MALLAQHGHGKSSKIDDGLSNGSLNGVIFSPRNEQPANLQQCIADIRTTHSSSLLMVDPQFFVCTFSPPNEGKLADYSTYYKSPRVRTDFISPAAIQKYARTTLDFQSGLNVSRYVSPTVYFSTFDDAWHQIALQLADASLDYHSKLTKPSGLLLSFLFSEAALDDRPGLDAFLDFLTSLDVDGFYFTIAREEPAYTNQFDSERLSRLLYSSYSLGSLNNYELVFGYSDFVGLLLRAVGASAFANGWYQSLRRFQKTSFIQRSTSGGQRPRLRYSSGPLLTSILLSELEQVFTAKMEKQVLSGVSLDSHLTSATGGLASTWNETLSTLHHWQTLQGLDASFGKNITKNLKQVEQWLNDARAIFARLNVKRVVLENTRYSTYLDEWERAINMFRTEVGV